MPRLSLLPLALAIAAAGCNGSLDVPVPALGAPVPLPPVEAATVALPITIPLATVRAQLEAQLPVTDSLDQRECSALGGVVCHQYVYRREPVLLDMRADRISLVARLRYRARVALPGGGSLGSCGYAPEAMRRAELRLQSSLYWRSDWRLAARGTQLAAALTDACRVTVLDLDAAPIMRRLLDGQLRTLTRTVDSLVPAVVDLRPAADSLWRSLQAPSALDSLGTLWLVMNPEGASLAPLSGAGGIIGTRLVVTARPRVVLGDAPAATARALPSLTLAPPADGIHVPVDIELPFALVSREATRVLQGEAAGQGLTVRDVRVWGVADTAVVRVDLAGKVTGALYLLGRVAYDPGQRRVVVQDLRYTLASASAMTRIKATLGAPLIRRALDRATSGSEMDVGAQLDSMRTQLTREMNRELAPGVGLEGAIHTIGIRGLYATQTAFVLRVVLDGEGRMVVR